jgi:(p)ppGpp synthase/HD superfamily hydrolase
MIETKALAYATEAHKGQVRKYTGEPYIEHPKAVADIVRGVRHTPAMIAAAYLHDVVEDTPIPLTDIRLAFGEDVAGLVYWLTDKSRPSDGNRAARKAIDRLHIAAAPPNAQTIKLADMIDNTSSIAERDPSFWVVYRKEKLALLEVLDKGDAGLLAIARARCA